MATFDRIEGLVNPTEGQKVNPVKVPSCDQITFDPIEGVIEGHGQFLVGNRKIFVLSETLIEATGSFWFATKEYSI